MTRERVSGAGVAGREYIGGRVTGRVIPGGRMTGGGVAGAEVTGGEQEGGRPIGGESHRSRTFRQRSCWVEMISEGGKVPLESASNRLATKSLEVLSAFVVAYMYKHGDSDSCRKRYNDNYTYRCNSMRTVCFRMMPVRRLKERRMQSNKCNDTSRFKQLENRGCNLQLDFQMFQRQDRTDAQEQEAALQAKRISKERSKQDQFVGELRTEKQDTGRLGDPL
jgi:hypothetical protein